MQGDYALSGGTLIVNNGGLANQGVLDLSNSTASISAYFSIVDLSHATLSNSQNVSLVVGWNSLLVVPAGFDPAAYFKSFANYGIVHQAGTTLTIFYPNTVNGAGDIADYVDCQGTLAASSGSFINLNAGVKVSTLGSASLGTGSVYVNDAISNVSGGSLQAANQYVGSMGAGTFTQSGGTNAIATAVYLGDNAADSGTYSLSGTGKLNAGNEYVGNSGTGVFSQSGGNNTISSSHSLYLGYNPTGSGSYGLSGTGALTAPSEYIGNSGAGTFTQSGGAIRSRPVSISAATRAAAAPINLAARAPYASLPLNMSATRARELSRSPVARIR